MLLVGLMAKTYHKKVSPSKPRNTEFIRKSTQVILDKREKEQQRRHEKRELDLKRWRAEYEKSRGGKYE